jgi:Domain of unknown function (DUF4349)
MKLRDRDPAPDPQTERELHALDEALAGHPVEPEMSDLAALAAELRDLRPGPDQAAAARLDDGVAALGESTAPGRGLAASWSRFSAAPLRRRLMPVAAAGLAAIVAATVVVSGTGTDSGSNPSGTRIAAETQSGAAPALPDVAKVRRQGATELKAGGGSGATAAPAQGIRPVPPVPTGPFASGERRRFNETSAELTLGTDAEHVQPVADDVFGVVGRYEGIVLTSSISDGAEGEAGASFSLLIPSAKLPAALADLSGIAEVRSRRESSQDITAPVVTTRERLRDARAEVEGLLKQLANADTDEERAAVKAQLRFQHRRVAGLRSALNGLQRRANFSRVSLDVVTGDTTAFGTGRGDGRWTIADALRDAGRVLSVAAGVTLVGLAVLAPLALLALLAWLARRAWLRQSRERALRGSGA